MNDDVNGRITAADRLARIETKLDNLIATLERHVLADDRCHQDLENRIRPLETGQEQRKTQIIQIMSEVEALQKKDTFGTLLAGGLAAIATLIGIFKP